MRTSDPTNLKYPAIAQTLQGVITTLAELIEDPIFLDNIHGEEEMNLDRMLELLDSILVHFTPVQEQPAFNPSFDAESFDAD